MNRDSKGRFCKANKTECKIPKLSPNACSNHERKPRFFKTDVEPLFVRIKIHPKETTEEERPKNRFDRDDCINNAILFSKLDLDEQAKFIGGLLDMDVNCLNNAAQCLSYRKCSECFYDWFFNMFDPDTFHKILGD